MPVANILRTILLVFGVGGGSLLLALLGGCGGGSSSLNPPPPPPASYAITGSVMSGLQPIAGASVVAYAVDMSAGARPVELGAASSDSGGAYKLAFTTDPNDGDLVYLSVSGGNAGAGDNAAIGLMTVAGPWCGESEAGCDFPHADLVVNERSTAASTAVFHRYLQFVDCATILGNDQAGTCAAIGGAPGLAATAKTLGNLLDIANAGAADFLAAQPDSTSIHLTLERMNTIASLLAGCVQADTSTTPNACVDLLGEVGNGAENTGMAAWLMASNADVNSDGAGLFALLPDTPAFTPILAAAPTSWTIGGVRYAYVANAAGSVSAYRIDPATGTPMPVTSGGAASCYGPGGPPFDPDNCFPAAVAPASIAASPNGRFVFVGNCDGPGNNISAYAVDPGTGALVEVAGSPFVGGAHPFSVAVNAAGTFLYVADIGPDGTGPRQGTLSVFAIDPVSGALSAVDGSPFDAGDQTHGIALDPLGRYVYASNFNSHSAAAWSAGTNGALTVIAGSVSCGDGMPATCFAAGTLPWKMAADASGHFVYGVNFGSDSISAWSIDSSSGTLAPVEGTASCGEGLSATCFAAGDFPIGIRADPAGPYIFVINCGNGDGHIPGVGQGSVQAYAVDPNTGALTLVNSVANGQSPHWGAADPAGQYLYVANSTELDPTVGNDVSVYAIDPDSGALAEIAGSPFFAGPGASAVAVTP